MDTESFRTEKNGRAGDFSPTMDGILAYDNDYYKLEIDCELLSTMSLRSRYLRYTIQALLVYYCGWYSVPISNWSRTN